MIFSCVAPLKYYIKLGRVFMPQGIIFLCHLVV
jgi:hypothetical protein